MRRMGLRFGARELAWLALAAGYAAMLWQSFPGQMSVDSVIELHEGRFHVRENWGPAIYAWLLGLFDRISPGTGLYLVASGLLLFGAWAALPLLRGRASWWFVPAAAGVVVLPDVVIYQGIVWHDVLFANVAVAGFICLGFAARAWDGRRRPWIRLALSVLLISVAGLVRQNGIVLLPIAALAVGWVAWGSGWRRAGLWAGGWLLAAVAATAVLSVTALPQGPGFEKANTKGFRALAAYDLVGALAHDPALPLPHITAESPHTAAVLRAEAARYYSPQRIDFIQDSAALNSVLIPLSTPALVGDWKELILKRPDLYLPLRLAAFRWVVATPVIDVCLPVYLGVDGPPKQMAELGLKRTWGDREDRLLNYASWFYDTPALSHLAHAALALLVLLALLWRRDPADRAMAGMLVGAFAFTATFLPLSLACDYRYLYFLDMAALTGLLYLAADPRLGRAA